ncbi:MAG: hypothetical protein ACTHN5_15965 [Phycisphaerae bacterium]
MSETPETGSYDFAPEKKGEARNEPAEEIPLVEPEGGAEAAVKPAPRKPQQAIPDRICPHCGFNIFGKTRGGRCPQCAAPLEHAATDLLQFSSPGWLRTMSNGLILVGAAIGGHVFAAALRWNQPRLGAVIHVVAAGVLFLGTLTATRMESEIGGKVLTGTAPARWMSLAAAAVWVVVLLLVLGIGHYTHAAAKWLTVLAMGLSGVFAIAFGLYNRALTERIPDDGLANQSINISWLAGIVCVALMVIQALDLTTTVHLMFFFCSFPMIGGFLAIFVWSMVVVLRTAFELRASAEAGESISAKRAQWAANQNKGS